jgi:outer membrane protein assembly factor BamB
MHIACYGAANPSSNFTIQIIRAPYVATISPTSSSAGNLVTLSGFGFGATRGSSYVKFGTVTATNYYSWTNTQIKVYVPAGVASGTIQVTVYLSSAASNPKNFVNNGVSSEGTMWRYDLGRSGNYPNGPTTLPLNLKWSYDIGAGTPIASSPVVANNIVYFGGDKLCALDANTGIFKWSYTADGWVHSSPTIAKGVVYFGSVNGRFYAVDANTGSLKWVYNDAYFTGDITCSPVVADNRVYFAVGKKLYALDATSGSLRWSYTVTGSWGIRASPTVVNGMVYFADSGNRDPVYNYTNDKICALDSLTGAVKWIYTLPHQTPNGTAAVVNNILYVGIYDHISNGGVLALDANTGGLKWYYHATGWPATPVVANGTVYIDSVYNTYALDANTGIQKWRVFGRGTMTAPSFSNGFIYIVSGCGGVLYALDANTGVEKWSYVIGGFSGDNSSCHIVNGKVYIGSSNGKLYCFGQ